MADLRVLIAEDDPLDAELVVRELTKSGYDPEWHRVDTAEAFKSRLTGDRPDVVVSDHAMPQFSAAEALRLVTQSGWTIPFIVVSHAIGEEEAVELMRRGAADFLMKDRLGRLGEAVRHALEQHRLRAEHAAAQRAIEERTRDLVASQQHLRALASELTLAEQRERKRLAAELHDYLAQMLALGQMKISQLRPKLASAPAVAAPIGEIDDLFKNALTYTRSLMAKLSPPVLDELGLPAALRWLADQMPLHGLSVDVRLTDDHVPLPDDQAVLLFQSVRELLLNVSKHAGTDRAAVILGVDDNHRLRIEVQDAGKGFDPAAVESKSAGEHFGLFSVRERMEAMGGWLEVKSAVGQGTTITLALPLGSRSETSSKFEVRSSESAGHTVGTGSVHIEHRTDNIERHQQNATIRVLLVDDHTLVRRGLKALLDGYPDVSVIGEAGNGQEALTLAAQLTPNIVLMDIAMPWMDGVEATRRIKQEWPEILVIGLSVNNSPQAVEAMTAAGAASFVPKDTAAEQLYDAIAAAMSVGVPAEQVRQARLF